MDPSKCLPEAAVAPVIKISAVCEIMNGNDVKTISTVDEKIRCLGTIHK